MAHARHARSAPRIAAALAGVISLALVVGALTGPVASAAPSTKFYTGTVTPGTATPGGTQTYTFAIADSSGSTQSLGSANINVPADFTSVTVGAVTPPPGKVWTATLVSGQIKLRNPGPGSTSRLDPGESVSVLVTATAPTSCGSFTWTTAAKQSNDFNGTGNDFVLSGTDPTISTIGCQVADHVSFGQGPTDVQVASPITPAVTVLVQDASGNTVTSSTAAITLAIGTNPSGGVLSGTSNCPAGPGTVCQSAVGGVATFADLSIDTAGTGYTLGASSPGLTGATSGAFNVLVVLAPCVAGGCVGSTGASATSTNTTVLQNVSIPARLVDGTLELGSDPSSEAVAATFCGGQACLAGSFIMQVVPPTNSTYLTDQPITVILALDKSIALGTGVPHFKVFSGSSLSGVGTVLAGCPKKGPITVKCISEQHRDNAGDVVITILIPIVNGQAVDPYIGPR